MTTPKGLIEYTYIVEVDVPRRGYRWFGIVKVEFNGEILSLLMTGNIAQWLYRGIR